MIRIGVASAGDELQRASGADDTARLGIAKRRFHGRAVQHGDRPIIAQARLVVTELQRGRCRLFERRQPVAHVGVEHRRIGKLGEQRRARELLGNGAHAEQSARCERDAALGIGKSPRVLGEDLAPLQHGAGTARSGIGACKLVDCGVEFHAEPADCYTIAVTMRRR